MLSPCGLQPCARTHQKKALCHTCPLGGARNKYRSSAPLLLLGRTSAGRAGCGMDLAECVSAAGDFLRPQGALPPGFYLLRMGLGLLPGAWVTPNKGNAEGAEGIFDHARRVWASTLRPDPP